MVHPFPPPLFFFFSCQQEPLHRIRDGSKCECLLLYKSELQKIKNINMNCHQMKWAELMVYGNCLV